MWFRCFLFCFRWFNFVCVLFLFEKLMICQKIIFLFICYTMCSNLFYQVILIIFLFTLFSSSSATRTQNASQQTMERECTKTTDLICSLAAVAPLWSRLMVWHRYGVFMLLHVHVYFNLYTTNRMHIHTHPQNIISHRIRVVCLLYIYKSFIRHRRLGCDYLFGYVFVIISQGGYSFSVWNCCIPNSHLSCYYYTSAQGMSGWKSLWETSLHSSVCKLQQIEQTTKATHIYVINMNPEALYFRNMRIINRSTFCSFRCDIWIEFGVENVCQSIHIYTCIPSELVYYTRML